VPLLPRLASEVASEVQDLDYRDGSRDPENMDVTDNSPFENTESAWFIPSKKEVYNWMSQFASKGGEEVEFSPFDNSFDALLFDYIFERKGVLTRGEAERVINLVHRVLEIAYVNLETSTRTFPSSFSHLKRCFDTMRVASVQELQRETRLSGRDRGQEFISQAARLPSQILYQTFLNPQKSGNAVRIFPRESAKPSKENLCHAPGVLCSESIRRSLLRACVCCRLPAEEDKFVFLDDEVDFIIQSEERFSTGLVEDIFTSPKYPEGCAQVLRENELPVLLNIKDILVVRPNWSGRGRRVLQNAGLTAEIEIVPVPLMIFSDDMNAGRTKTFSKMDNTILVLPSVPDGNSKSRHHVSSTKAATLQQQLEAVFEDITRLQKGAVMFDAWRGRAVLVVADLIAIIADNPRANEICGQMQKRCRYCWCPFELRRELQNPFIDGPRRETADFNQYLKFKNALSTPESHNLRRHGSIKKLRELDILAGFRSEGRAFHEIIRKPPSLVMPVEILHTILLGIVKYMAYELFRYAGDGEAVGITPHGKRNIRGLEDEETFLQTRMDWRGVRILRTLDSSSLRHIGGWVGGHFKTFAQIAPLFLAGSGRRQGLLRCLLATCTLFKLLYRRPLQLTFETYKRLVSEAVDQFLVCVKDSCTLAFSKYKIHLLLHLPDHLELFSSLPDVCSEVEESMNGIFRTYYASGSGRKKTESLYLSTKLAQRDSYLHYLSGGYVPDEESGLLRKIPVDLQKDILNKQTQTDILKSANGRPSHPNPVIGDFVFWETDAGRYHGLVTRVAQEYARITLYEFARSQEGFLIDELGNLALSKSRPSLSKAVQKRYLVVLNVYQSSISLLTR
tara:strand:+ start:2047 stop:4593 length:2547 start_codon:yes stop_codon:yes gene_type:complete